MTETQERVGPAAREPDERPRAAAESLPELGYVAAGAGLLGLLLYRLLIGYPLARYAIPVVDAVALMLGVWLLWRAARGRGGLDMAIAALATAAFSLYLFLAYVTGPPPAPGGT